MRRFQRTTYRGEGIAGLEQIGHDARPGVLPLPEHDHTGAEICYVASGEVAWIVGRGERMHLVGGMLSMIPPGVPHHGELDAIAPSDLYWIVLSPRHLQPALPDALLRTLERGRPFVANAGEPFRERFDRIMAEFGGRSPGWRAAVMAHASLLAVETARLAPERGREGTRPAPPPIARAASFLAEHLEDPPGIGELARQVGLGTTRFHALFRRAIGMTPRDYLGRLRLRAARQALQETDEEITSIAVRLGYPSSQYFAAAFRRHTGLTPRAYRAVGRKH